MSSIEKVMDGTSSKTSKGEANLELAKLYFGGCDFEEALPKAQASAAEFFADKNMQGYLKALNIILRIYAEQDKQELVNNTKETLQDLVLRDGFDLSSRTYYTLGICACYKRQMDLAIEYFQKGLAIALAGDQKEEMCLCINGIAICYAWTGRYQDALKEIYNLNVFFQLLDLPELKISSQILNGWILNQMNRHEEAIHVLNEAFETLKLHKSLFMYIQLLYAMGVTYKAMGNTEMARFYLQLAKQTVDTKSLTRTANDITKQLSELGVSTKTDFDIVFNSSKNSLVEKKKGKVDFKNQFILLDLLHMFLKEPGQVFSKEDITSKLWNESYDPHVHDNKIYVTIKRLRQLIEPDIDKPRYIFRAKNGYYLNKDTKVMLEQ